MDASIPILLLVVGIFFILAEIFVIPGATVFGIIGGIIMLIGIVLGYTVSSTLGHILLFSGLFGGAILTYIAYRVLKTSNYSLHDVSEGKVNVLEEGSVNVGDKGVTTSALRPQGKAYINEQTFEVSSVDDFVDENVEIVVTQVQGNKIFVTSKTS